MKKSILLIIVIAAFGFQSNAQEISKNAIGVRIGDSGGFGPEVNYQRTLGDNNRLELGLGWQSDRNYDTAKLTGIYQWVWNIDGSFNWYAGPGAGVGLERYEYYDTDSPFNNKKYRDSEAFVFVTGDVGIEYNFDFPLLVSLDVRPRVNLGSRDDLNIGVGLSARYQF